MSFYPDCNFAFELLRLWNKDPEAADDRMSELATEVGSFDLLREFLLFTGTVFSAEPRQRGLSDEQLLAEWRQLLD
jgi:hypothetical protein